MKTRGHDIRDGRVGSGGGGDEIVWGRVALHSEAVRPVAGEGDAGLLIISANFRAGLSTESASMFEGYFMGLLAY